MCSESNVHHSDRWRFELVDEQDETDCDEFWLCRVCHGKFEGVDDFDKFRKNSLKMSLYRQASRLRRLLLLGAPSVIIQGEVQAMVCRLMYDDDGKVDERFRDSIKNRCEDSNA
jgi:hypothetical protein